MAIKPIDDFYKHPQMGDGHINKCKDCTKKDVRNNYKDNKDYYREYDKYRQRADINRIFSHRYNSLKARCEVSYAHSKSYTVTGMPYLSKEEFMGWCTSTIDEFMAIYKQWEQSGFNSKLMPSVDRIDSTKGYILGNIQWLSKSENSKKYMTIDDPEHWTKGYKTRWKKDYSYESTTTSNI